MNFERLQTGIDVAPIRDALAACPTLWRMITARQDYPGSAHRDTQCIFIRGPEAFTPEAYQGTVTAIDYPAAATPLGVAVQAILGPLLEALGVSELGYVLVVSLKAGGVIDEHVDEGAYAEHYERFHLAITGEPSAALIVNGERQHFAPGELWRFDHRSSHWAENPGATDRIHVIFDAVRQ